MKNLFITLLLFVLSCAMLHGQTKPRLAVWLKSGEKVYFELDAEPETTFSGSYMIIKTLDSELFYPKTNVVRYTFEGVQSGIELLPDEYAVKISRNEHSVTFKNLKEGTEVRLYGVNGILLEAKRAEQGKTITLSAANYPSGIYIIRYGSENIKILRP